MNMIAFDTCLDKMYVTLANQNEVLTSKIVLNQDNKYHSAFLISTIKEVLKENNLTPQEIGAIATNIGPGSFTGIRACTTVARIMGQQLGIPVVGVSSLEILEKLAPDEKSALVALDARKNSAYLRIDGETKGAIQLEEIEKILSSGDYFVITDDKLQTKLGGISYQQKEYPLGEILANLAFKKLETENCEWKNLKPLYIQPPPVF